MTVAPITASELDNVVRTIPAAPRLLAQLAPRLQQIEVPLSEITTLLRRDAAITARLIASANSAAYARFEPATSVEDAVTCLGYREVYRIVGALAVTQLTEEPLSLYGIDAHRFRENSLFVALVMEELAAEIGEEPRNAYTIGLLRSVGKVALVHHLRNRSWLQRMRPTEQSLADWETVMFGNTNTDVGARVLEAWGFPVEMTVVLRDHYEPGPEALAMSHLMNLAAGAAQLRGFGFPGEETYWQFTVENFERTAVDEGKLVWAGERAFQTLSRICDALA